MATESVVMTESRTWRIDDRVAWTDMFERAAVLPLGDGDATPLVLEGSAYAVWRVLTEGPIFLEELVSLLATEFDTDPELLRDDVGSLLSDLRSWGVLTCD